MSDTLKGGHHTPERTLMPTPLQILQLEDDPGDVRHIADLLRDANLSADITVAGSRAEFLTALARGGFDLVLADYQLPGFDGLQALALWRERRPDTPFLFVTGAMGEERAIESLKSGATDYILKENLARLVPAVRRALKEAEESARRLAAEGALRAETERRHILFEQLPDGILVIDPPTARFVEFNTAAHQQLGYSREEFARLTIHDVEAKETDAETKARIAGLAMTGWMDFETLHRTRQGEIRNVQVTARLVNVQGRAVYQAVWRDITEAKQAEAALRLHGEQLRALWERLERLREEERTRIAREVHEVLGQLLTVLKMDVSWWERRFHCITDEPLRRSLEAKVEQTSRLADLMIATVQKIARELRPSVLDHIGLGAALQFEARQFQERSGIACQVSVPSDTFSLEPERTTGVFRVFQELLTNVARHAQATRVTVALSGMAAEVTLEVRDNGRGIRAEELSNPQSLGLLGMRERASLLGGRFRLRGEPGAGTVATLTIPAEFAAQENQGSYAVSDCR